MIFRFRKLPENHPSYKPLNWFMSGPNPQKLCEFAHHSSAENIARSINELYHDVCDFTVYGATNIDIYYIAILFDSESDEAAFILKFSDGLEI